MLASKDNVIGILGHMGRCLAQALSEVPVSHIRCLGLSLVLLTIASFG